MIECFLPQIILSFPKTENTTASKAIQKADYKAV